jgi:hypothetical protein
MGSGYTVPKMANIADPTVSPLLPNAISVY